MLVDAGAGQTELRRTAAMAAAAADSVSPPADVEWARPVGAHRRPRRWTRR
jgi:hypothetical protein